MKKMGAVDIISAAMQANPDFDKLMEEGANALRVLAGEDDLSRALNIITNPNKYNNKVITQALGLLGNLALIQENANYIVGKGGINALMDLIKLKGKNANLSPEEVALLDAAIRALGRLLDDPNAAKDFGKQGGMNMLKDMLNRYDKYEPICNAVMDALQNLAKHEEGRKMILDSGILTDVTKVLAKHPGYDVMMRKYAQLLSTLPLNDRNIVQPLIDAGLLDVICKQMLANYENGEAVIANMDLMKELSKGQAHLTSGLIHDNSDAILKSIRCHQNNPDVLKHIFDALHTMAGNDPTALDYLKKHGLEQELLRILKQDNLDDKVLEQVKAFYDSLLNDGIDINMNQLLNSLQGLGYALDDPRMTQQTTDVQARTRGPSQWTDPSAVLAGLNEIATLLDDPNYAKKFVTEGQVNNILDSIQQFYDNPNVVIAGLGALTKCAAVAGCFPILEEAGVPEAIIQCMLEHPDNQKVQLEGLKALAALASHNDPLVVESLCQPITLETAIKALNSNMNDPNTVMAFADLINNLLNDPNTAPIVAQALISEGVGDALKLAMDKHKANYNVTTKCGAALAKLEQYGLAQPSINHIGAGIGTSVNFAKLKGLNDDQLKDEFHNYGIDELMTTLKASKDERITESSANEINERLGGGDEEAYNHVVGKGGIGDLLAQAAYNMEQPGALGACLDTIGTLSTDDRLRTLLGMHGTIKLILECMRRHPNDIELLDKCCYILSNLSYDNGQNMTTIIELGGINDIVGVTKKHRTVNFVCESAINVLCNLCHNSDKNKVLIARSGGSNVTIQALKEHGKCVKQGDVQVVVSGFRCLANLGYVDENVTQMVKEGAVPVVMDVMANNVQSLDLVQMGVVVLGNLSSHEKIAAQMVQLGVLDLIIKISEAFPDIIELQRSCLGCIGNLMNEQSNSIAFLDKKGHLRLFGIMEELGFEESVLTLCFQLIKVLCTQTDIALHLAEEGAIKISQQVILDNKGNQRLVSLGCQALCKLIPNLEAAKVAAKNQLADILVEIAKDGSNFKDITVMNELTKVVVNFGSIEENAQPFSRHGAVSLLKAMEIHYDNPIFLNNAAMALSKLSIHPTASRHLVKRGVVAVILDSLQKNKDRRAVVERYIRTLSNLVYTEHKAAEEITNNGGFEIVSQIAQQHMSNQKIQNEYLEFEKAMKLKAQKIGPSQTYNIPIRDKMDPSNVRLVSGGTVMLKHSVGSKPKKRLVRTNQDCTLLLFEDQTGKKAPKQLNMKSVKSIRQGNQGSQALAKVNNDVCFSIISVDPNSREFIIDLECKSSMESQRWINALTDLIQANQQ